MREANTRSNGYSGQRVPGAMGTRIPGATGARATGTRIYWRVSSQPFFFYKTVWNVLQHLCHTSGAKKKSKPHDFSPSPWNRLRLVFCSADHYFKLKKIHRRHWTLDLGLDFGATSGPLKLYSGKKNTWFFSFSMESIASGFLRCWPLLQASKTTQETLDLRSRDWFWCHLRAFQVVSRKQTKKNLGRIYISKPSMIKGECFAPPSSESV